HHAAVRRVDLHAVAATARPLGGNQGRPRAQERVDHDVVWPAAILDSPLAEGQRLDRRVLGRGHRALLLPDRVLLARAVPGTLPLPAVEDVLVAVVVMPAPRHQLLLDPDQPLVVLDTRRLD